MGIKVKNPKRFFLIPSRHFHQVHVAFLNKKYARYLTKDDYVIRFNRISKTNKLLFRNQTDFRLIRGGLGIGTYRSSGRLRGDSPPSTHLMIVRDDNEAERSKRIRKILNANPHIKKHSLITRSEVNAAYKRYQIRKGNPSLGFYAIDYILQKYPKAQIILIGFQWKGFQGHNFRDERQKILELIEKNKNCIILERI